MLFHYQRLSFKQDIKDRWGKMFYFHLLFIVQACQYKQQLIDLEEKYNLEKLRENAVVNIILNQKNAHVLSLKKKHKKVKNFNVTVLLLHSLKFFNR